MVLLTYLYCSVVKSCSSPRNSNRNICNQYTAKYRFIEHTRKKCVWYKISVTDLPIFFQKKLNHTFSRTWWCAITIWIASESNWIFRRKQQPTIQFGKVRNRSFITYIHAKHWIKFVNINMTLKRILFVKQIHANKV